jgi:hypothetical protein
MMELALVAHHTRPANATTDLVRPSPSCMVLQVLMLLLRHQVQVAQLKLLLCCTRVGSVS